MLLGLVGLASLFLRISRLRVQKLDYFLFTVRDRKVASLVLPLISWPDSLRAHLRQMILVEVSLLMLHRGLAGEGLSLSYTHTRTCGVLLLVGAVKPVPPRLLELRVLVSIVLLLMFRLSEPIYLKPCDVLLKLTGVRSRVLRKRPARQNRLIVLVPRPIAPDVGSASL